MYPRNICYWYHREYSLRPCAAPQAHLRAAHRKSPTTLALEPTEGMGGGREDIMTRRTPLVAGEHYIQVGLLAHGKGMGHYHLIHSPYMFGRSPRM